MYMRRIAQLRHPRPVSRINHFVRNWRDPVKRKSTTCCDFPLHYTPAASRQEFSYAKAQYNEAIQKMGFSDSLVKRRSLIFRVLEADQVREKTYFIKAKLIPQNSNKFMKFLLEILEILGSAFVIQIRNII